MKNKNVSAGLNVVHEPSKRVQARKVSESAYAKVMRELMPPAIVNRKLWNVYEEQPMRLERNKYAPWGRGDLSGLPYVSLIN